MARETWKCPYADCKQECSRKWNLQRHIIRSHGGEGKPVKNKSSADIENELDLIDIAYQKFKKYKDRNDKVEEMINYSANNNSRIPFPSHFPLDMFNYHPSATFDPPVGFKTYICADCLTAPIDPVKLSDFIMLGPLAFNTRHICKLEDLENRKRRIAEKQKIDVITTWDELRKLSIQHLAERETLVGL